MFENCDDAVLHIDRDGTINDANSKAEEFAGQPRHELVGKPFSLFGVYKSETTDTLMRLFKEAVDRDVTYPREVELFDRHGKTVVLELSIVDSISLAFASDWPEAKLVSARFGEDGLDLLEAEEPDVVLLDLLLPDMHGLDVLKAIRRFSRVPVVVLSVRDDESTLTRALELGGYREDDGERIWWPYYRADIESGRITRENAIELVECLFLKIQEIGAPLEWPLKFAGVSGANTMYTANICGTTADGRDATNDLSFIILEALGNLHVSQPPVALQYHSQISPEIISTAIDLGRTGLGHP